MSLKLLGCNGQATFKGRTQKFLENLWNANQRAEEVLGGRDFDGWML
jgi:hypothetical protein